MSLSLSFRVRWLRCATLVINRVVRDSKLGGKLGKLSSNSCRVCYIYLRKNAFGDYMNQSLPPSYGLNNIYCILK